MFIQNSISLHELNLLFDMYYCDILYDNQLTDTFQKKKRELKLHQEYQNWPLSLLN